MATYFQTKISYLKQAENGSIYKKQEQYLLNAESFTEAEARLQSVLEKSIPEYNLLTLCKANIVDVILSKGAESFYKTTIVFAHHDDDTGKEKKIKQPYLIQANSIEEANKILLETMKGTVVDYESIKVEKTKIVDVFEINSK